MNGADTTGATVIRRAARGDVPASGAVLAAAFHEDPVTSWLLPDEPTRHRRLGLLFAAFLRHQYLRHGATDLATDATGGGITAAALWTPPGHWREPAWRDLLGVPAYLRALGRRVAAGSALTATLQGTHPHRPHWYLGFLGTGPAAQGRGVGGDLLGHGLARCDRRAEPAYLEASNERVVPFYERHGFEVTGEITVPDGGPTVWAMWRTPVR